MEAARAGRVRCEVGGDLRRGRHGAAAGVRRDHGAARGAVAAGRGTPASLRRPPTGPWRSSARSSGEASRQEGRHEVAGPRARRIAPRAARLSPRATTSPRRRSTRRCWQHFRVSSDDDLVDRLGTDIRYIDAAVHRAAAPDVRRRLEHQHLGHPPPADAQRVRRVRRAGGLALRRLDDRRGGRGASPGPSPDWFDYDAIPALCARYPQAAIAAGGFGVQDFINGVAFGRGVEQVLLDIALEDPVYLYIVERRHRFYLRHIERILDGGPRADRPGALRRRLRQPARAADLAGHLRPAVRAEEEGVLRPGPRARREGDAPLLRVEPRAHPAVHRVRHGRPADDPAPGRGHEPLRAEGRVRRPDLPARRGGRAGLAPAGQPGGDPRARSTA